MKLPDLMEKAYRLARREARAETGVAESKFPRACHWTFDQVMKRNFWPEISPEAD